MWLLLGAMSKVRRAPARVDYSPDPVTSDREPVGKYVTVDGIRTYYEECGDGRRHWATCARPGPQNRRKSQW